MRIFPNGWVKSRHLDDKASVAALFGILEAMKREGIKPARTVKFLISTYEEVGHGSAHIPDDVVKMIAVDMELLATIYPQRRGMFRSVPRIPRDPMITA